MKWRFEACAPGKSFGEIALMRSLRYKVQQVFLIQRETGWCCSTWKRRAKASVKPNWCPHVDGDRRLCHRLIHRQAVAGIRSGADGRLHALGSSWSAGVSGGTILGTPPPELKNVFARENELIHQEFAGAWRPSTATPASSMARDLICRIACSARRRVRKGVRWWLVALAAVLIALLALEVFAHRHNSRWNHYLSRLQSEPGIVITGWRRVGDTTTFAGLRDPLARRSGEAGLPTLALTRRA